MPSSTMKQSDTKKEFTHEELLNALYFVWDMFSRPNLPFFLLGNIAKSVYENKRLSGDKITVGIRKVDAQYSSLTIIYAFWKADKITDECIYYTYRGVPIEVLIIDSRDQMFTSTDTKMYENEAFSLPNPFTEYWTNYHHT